MSNKIKKFFDKHIVSLHKQHDTNDSFFLDVAIDKTKDSYFEAPRHPEYLYLSNISFETEAKLEEYLKEFWKDQPLLLNLVPDLSRLAFMLKEEHREQSAELSPFIYTMF